ncbi:MAG: hypothetical protein D6816_18380, partial [Bacteroidetes bacterium]
AIRVRRSSDDAEQDIGFGTDDFLDTAALTAFVGSGDGYVTTWYSQIPGKPDLVQTNTAKQPLVAEYGVPVTSPTGKPAVRFLGIDVGDDGDRLEATGFPDYVHLTNYTFYIVMQVDPVVTSERAYGGLGDWNGAVLRWGAQSYINTNAARFGEMPDKYDYEYRTFFLQNKGSEARLYSNNSLVKSVAISQEPDLDIDKQVNQVHVGRDFTGIVSEFVAFPYYMSQDVLWSVYSNSAASWETGPISWNENAILPQDHQYQVTLYDWIESLSVQDVTLNMGQTFTWDASNLSDDEKADLWLDALDITTSRVVRAEPEWYVLDAGNGKGIEATGQVRIWHEPGSGYGGNPARSWANEPAYLYQLDIPLSDGGQGNPYYKDPAMGRRALVIAMVDMMMHDRNRGTSTGWFDMIGKAFQSWVQTYIWCSELLPSDVKAAYETGLERTLDYLIDIGPRAVNTNMDMFALRGAGELYAGTTNQALRDKSLQVVKRALFGYVDGELEVPGKHSVFKAGGGYDGGVFDPSGFIMEGDQPVLFYGGESIYHLTGALAAVTDRNTGEVDPNWLFLKEVVRRLWEWRGYQIFYDPDQTSPYWDYLDGGSGISGRMGYGPAGGGQADATSKLVFVSDMYPDLHWVMRQNNKGGNRLPELTGVRSMDNVITDKLEAATTEMQSIYIGTPPVWNGWSPWIKEINYKPPKGWFSRLKALIDADDPSTFIPAYRRGYYYNKAFGGYPVGNEYWSYKGNDGTNDFGFFIEAQARQGTYGAWFGGKIETFWTDKTGIIILTRKGKSGCDGEEGVWSYSECWFNLEYRLQHHVWGRDENGKGFTVGGIRGRELARTSTFDLDAPTPSVTVVNHFNDPSHAPNQANISGEETGYEIEGSVQVENKFEALSNGLRVTHTIISDGTDQITELWATLPIYFRHYDPDQSGDDFQVDLEDTSIEYWDGTLWQPMPEDQNGDGIPELVTTTKIRLGRDFLNGSGKQYAYIGFPMPQAVRLADRVYTDPAGTKTRGRNLHFDMHGNPGTAIPMPTNKSLQYTITTTEPGGG